MILLYKSDDGRVPPIEYLPCAAITPKVGMALYQSAGNLTTATETQAPAYISLFEAKEAVTAGTLIPVMRVSKECVYRTVNSEAFTSIKRGDKVTLDATGGKVTATTTSGVAEVVGFDGTDVGSDVYVRF